MKAREQLSFQHTGFNDQTQVPAEPPYWPRLCIFKMIYITISCFILMFFFSSIYLFVCVEVRGQLRGRFSPTLRVPGSRLNPSILAASAFTQ